MAKQALDEKAKDFANQLVSDGFELNSPYHFDVLTNQIEVLLKQQDRDTRHACAELVAETRSVALPTETMGKINMIVKDAAHDAIMNCRGGIE